MLIEVEMTLNIIIIIIPVTADYDDYVTHTSKISYQAIARQGLVNIKCTAANNQGSVDQQFTTVIECKHTAWTIYKNDNNTPVQINLPNLS